MSQSDQPEAPTLVTVDPAPKLPEANNFWNTCHRKLDSLPDSPCSMGCPLKNKNGRIISEPACPWWVDSEKYNYCFWRFIQSHSLPDGKMDFLLQNEIAQLLGCSTTKVHFVVKEAIQKLKESDHLEALADFSSEDPQGTESETSLERLGVRDSGDSDEA